LINSNVYRENGRFVHTRCFTRDITERKAAEETRRPDEHVSLLVQAVRDYAIFMLDCDGHVVTWNTGAKLLKGYAEAEILGRHFSCFYTAEDRQAGKPQRLLTLAREHGRVEDEGWRVRKDGTRFWADVVLTALPDDSGHLRGFVKITRDLTERKQAEEALRKAEQTRLLESSHDALLRLLESSHDALFVRDAEDRITYWNKGAVETYGYAPEEALGKVPHELLRTEFPGPLESIRETLHRDNRWSGELIQRRRDGERVVVISRWVLDRDAQGGPGSILESNNDITERKRAEAALRRWEYIFNHAGWAVAIGDPFDNTLLFANPAYATMHGYTVEELIGKPVANVFAPESRSDFPKHAAAVDQHGDYVYESLHLHKDGTRFPVRTHVTAFKDETGRVLYRASISQDLTDHKRAERERDQLVAALQQERRQLQETQRALEEKLRDLETFHDAAVGRELKIIELQREVRRLQQQLDGRPSLANRP
jgi:PAS domain S-box-containing protein